MEGHINAFEGDGGKSALQLDGLGFGFGLLGAFTDDLDEVGFDVVEGEFLHEGLDVYFLRFEIVRNASKAVESAELFVMLAKG